VSRWSETYKSKMPTSDNIDRIDNMKRAAGQPGHSVNIVNNVTVEGNESGAATAAVAASYNVNTVNIVTGTANLLSFDDAVERAAIRAEALLVRRTRKRMVSWSNPADLPQPGDYCGCCSGALWWTDAATPRGWCCTTCHPPVHLEAGQFRVVGT
jgi:hypothetical protein